MAFNVCCQQAGSGLDPLAHVASLKAMGYSHVAIAESPHLAESLTLFSNDIGDDSNDGDGGFVTVIGLHESSLFLGQCKIGSTSRA